ncbi:MAG TPA: bifunctional riboflavin kinase/FAD synthetase [Bacteroidales bacterium]|nr:bifunctional riboflavin kinase/FAD synthetase [Bacteroidales bacterium]
MLDGVHLGHQKILQALINKAKYHNGKSVIITFWPHPRLVISNEPILLLNTLDEKLSLIREKGVDYVFILPFTREFSMLSPDKFILFLYEELKFKGIIIGYDHHFGKDGSGNFNLVKKISKSFIFDVVQVSAFKKNNKNISSTKIRNLLLSGNILRANEFLGYHYTISGTVIKGNKLGCRLGFPTANLKIPQEKLIPANGVYAVKVFCRNGQSFLGMLNIGKKPTVNTDTKKLFIEVHIFNFDRDIYGESITASILDKIRDEKKFSNTNELKKQLEKDKQIISQRINHWS